MVDFSRVQYVTEKNILTLKSIIFLFFVTWQFIHCKICEHIRRHFIQDFKLFAI